MKTMQPHNVVSCSKVRVERRGWRGDSSRRRAEDEQQHDEKRQQREKGREGTKGSIAARAGCPPSPPPLQACHHPATAVCSSPWKSEWVASHASPAALCSTRALAQETRTQERQRGWAVTAEVVRHHSASSSTGLEFRMGEKRTAPRCTRLHRQQAALNDRSHHFTGQWSWLPSSASGWFEFVMCNSPM